MDKSKFDKILEESVWLRENQKAGKNASVTADDGTVFYFDGDVIAVDPVLLMKQ